MDFHVLPSNVSLNNMIVDLRSSLSHVLLAAVLICLPWRFDRPQTQAKKKKKKKS